MTKIDSLIPKLDAGKKGGKGSKDAKKSARSPWVSNAADTDDPEQLPVSSPRVNLPRNVDALTIAIARSKLSSVCGLGLTYGVQVTNRMSRSPEPSPEGEGSPIREGLECVLLPLMF